MRNNNHKIKSGKELKLPNALILIDYINDIVHPAGKFSAASAMLHEKNTVANCNKTLAYARKNNWLILWVKVAFSANYPEVSANSPIFSTAKQLQALAKGSWGTELLADLDYQEPEIIIYKNRISPFYATNLELILRTQQIDTLYLAGVSTDWAIEAAARDAHDRNFKVIILENLCASSSLENHNQTLKVISRIAKVVNSHSLEPN